MVVGQLELQLFASMARLQSDMDKAKRSVGDAVGKMNQILGTIGIGISVAGFTSLIKSVVDVGDRFNDLKKITGLTVEQLAGLEKAALLNGSSLDQVAKAVGIMSKNIVAGSAALQSLGVATKQSNGEFRASNEVLLDVADRFSRMRDGVQKAALAQEIFGKSGRELIPLLNEGRAALESQIDAYSKASGMTTKLAEDSDRFNDILTLLGSKVSAVKNTFVAELLPALNNIGTAMLNSGQSTNQFSFAASVVVPVLQGLAIAAFTVVDTFRGMGREIGARAAQLAAFASMDFSGAKFIGQALAEDNAKARVEYDKFVATVMNGDKSVQQFTQTQKEYLKIEQQLPAAVGKTTEALKVKKALTDAEQLALLKQQESTKDTIALAQRVASVTDSVATEQEIYNRKLEELNKLKPYLTVQTYERALDKLNDTTKQTAVVTRQTTDAVTQFWIQANRNIQSSFANGIFDSFSDGLDGMVRSVKTAVLRIISEFAALKILEFFGGGIGGTGSTGGTVSTLASLASMFGGARTGGGGIATGGGVTTGAFSNAGGAGTAFIGGAGTALGGSGMGATATRNSSVLSGGNLMALGAMAGPYGMAAAAAFMAMQALEKKVGDYKLTGGAKFALGAYEMFSPMAYTVKGLGLQTPEALIGKFLFGRGPYKFRQQSIQGDISNQGLDGTITDVFKSKGGVFKSNKHKEFETALPSEIIRDIDKTLFNIYKSTNTFAKNLGMDASQIDKYTKEIQVISEKGKTITTEAVTEMLTVVADDVARLAMPNVESFSLTGESASKTFERLNTELETLKNAAQNLGASVGYAAGIINSMSIDARSAFVDQAGGIDRLNELTSAFFDGFLSDSEKLNIRTDQLSNALNKLGLSADLTKEQFKALVQSTDTSNEMRIGLLELVPAFLAVRTAVEQLGDVSENTAAQIINNTGPAFAQLQRAVNAERTRITNDYQAAIAKSDSSIKGVVDSIGRLKSLSDALKATTSNLNPLTWDQATSKIRDAIQTMQKGGDVTADSLRDALNVLGSKGNITGARSTFELDREQAKATILLNKLGGMTNSQLTLEERSLAALEAQRNRLDTGFSEEMARLDNILIKAQEQIDILGGIDVTLLSLSKALGNFNLRSVQAGGSAIGGVKPNGNASITDQQIRDYANAPGRTEMEIYNAAKKNGVSFEQYAAATGSQVQDLYDWAKKKNLPTFANGGMHSGGLRIVGERGPELERTGSSKITSNKDLQEMMSNKEVAAQVKKLNDKLDSVIQGNTYMRVKVMA